MAVDFDIEWADNFPSNDADPSPPASVSAVALTEPAVHVMSTPAETPGNDAPVRVEPTSALRDLGGHSLPSPPWSIDDDERHVYFQGEQSGVDTPEPSRGTFADGSQSTSLVNIQHLIEKGKALQQRMEQAVRFVDLIESDQRIQAGVPPEPAVRAAWENEFRAESAPSSLLQDVGGRAPVDRRAQSGEATLALGFPRPNGELYTEEGTSVDNSREETDAPAKGHADSMEMTFEQMELDRELIEQLRQLRDPSSVTSRFSPVKITVTHTDVASLFAANDSQIVGSPQSDSESTAFSVITSLRKRQWRPNCSKVSSVEIYAEQDTMHGWSSVRRVPNKRLTFRVVCENQSDAERRVRRRERGLFPLLTESIELCGSVGASELLDRVIRSDAWVAQVSLFLAEDTAQSPLPTRGNAKMKTKRKAMRHPVGQLQVKFRLFAAALRDEVGAHQDDASLTIMQNPDVSESGVFESSAVTSSGAPSTPTSQDARARAATTEAPLTPPFRRSRPRMIPATAARTVVTSPRYEKRFQASQGDASRMSMYREQLQFSLMIERVAVFPSSVVTESERTPASAEGAVPFVTIQYSVPYHFSNRLSVVRRNESVERRAKRKLARLQGNTRFAWVADFTGHSNVITSKFHADAADYFDRGILVSMFLTIPCLTELPGC